MIQITTLQSGPIKACQALSSPHLRSNSRPLRSNSRPVQYPQPFPSTHRVDSPSITRPPHSQAHQAPKASSEAKSMASTACFLHATTTTSARTPSSQRQLAPSNKLNLLVCRAQKQAPADDESAAVSRRLALAVLIGGAALGAKVSPADAAYGEAANVFGKPKTNTDFYTVSRDGFKLLIPSKWNPSKEVEYPGQVLRYEDNFDTTTNVAVMVTPTSKKSIKEYGSPEEFLSQVDYLLGKQAYSGKTVSEGGFDPDAVATANILEASTATVGGKDYYYIWVLTRTADGDEGGKHHLITATVSDGKLYLCKAQAGDKRWFKGARKYVESTAKSFNLA